ncbi:AMP-dependent synthetase/ligase [Sulfurospirillum arcachonense]|uniref:AMP-dependent synthetase/ligase n=1 Tax=Sulfurospirillum arcachonense TaxID=57666 RepID=UPI0004681098|nr:long-chain fatty acid--CoA ligase [Sulfurospirillum arcachonense]
MGKEIGTLFHMLIETYEKNRDKLAFIYRINDNKFDVTYQKLFDDVLILSRAFKAKGVKKGSKVMFLSDNRYEWIVTDLALVSLGAISIPRGNDTPTNELEFIMQHSHADFLITESESIYKEHEEMIKALKLKSIFIIEAQNIHTIFDNIYSYLDLIKTKEIFENEIKEFCASKNEISENDIFTLIYTSGTTGTPKGVILTHKNVMYNVSVLPPLLDLTSNDLWVSILPSWHIFERTAEYLAIANGCCVVYSTIKTFACDLIEFKPTIVATVPRLWESMYTKINNTLEKKDPQKAKIFKKLVNISAKYNYNLRVTKDELPQFTKENFLSSSIKKLLAYINLFFLYPFNLFAKRKLQLVQEKFGGRLRLAISGGGTLPDFLDTWIDAIGIRIVNAYGMTECAPAIAGRTLNCNTFSTLGLPIVGTDLRIVDDNGKDVKTGDVGEIILKGDQITPGYYENEQENMKSFTKDGYFRTGDLGKFTIKGELVITGRSKEIIVLANGENVDPSRIESTISMLPFITDTILVGQDKKGLGMLVVPDFDKLKEYVHENFDKVVHSMEHLLEDKQIVGKLKKDMNDLLHHNKGFKPFEKLQNIHFLNEDFKPGEELTNTFKKKRHIIEKKYKEVIDKFLH